MENQKTIAAIDPYEKRCKYSVCNKPFTAKRTDTQYCCREHKIKANNADAKFVRSKVGPRERQARANWKILDNFYRAGKLTVTLRELEFLGFDYSVVTGTVKNKEKTHWLQTFHEYALQLESQNINESENIYKIVKP